MTKMVLLILGILWSGGMLTAQVFKVLDLGTNRDFFLGVFGSCSMGLGLTKKKEELEPSSLEALKKDSKRSLRRLACESTVRCNPAS
jgi:hypothetical protein